MVFTSPRFALRMTGAGGADRLRGGRRIRAGIGEQEVGDPLQAGHVVNVAVEEGDPVDGGGRDLRHQGGRGLVLAVGGGRVAPEVVDQLVQ
jgi:hypothetical protein